MFLVSANTVLFAPFFRHSTDFFRRATRIQSWIRNPILFLDRRCENEHGCHYLPRPSLEFPHTVRGARQMKAEKSLEWQRLYQKTVAETDPEQLPEEIARAEAAILSRLKRLTQDEIDESERRAINDALAKLRALKVQHFPGWKQPDH
jgi:hypothetical protein